MYTKERENTVYVASTVSHACVYNIFKSHVSKVSFIHGDIPIKTQMLHIMDVILKVSCNTENVGGCISLGQ